MPSKRTRRMQLRSGPEAKLQRAVESQLEIIFPSQRRQKWITRTIPIGAGHPDIVIVTFTRKLDKFGNVGTLAPRIAGYLRTVSRAKAETISANIGQSRSKTVAGLKLLVAARVTSVRHGVYRLRSPWRHPADIVTIEVKAQNWRRAIAQASRNQVFAQRSFVALPKNIANRIKSDQLFRILGIGIIAVSPLQKVSVVRRSRSRSPRVWVYYYTLIFKAAKQSNGDRRAVQGADRRRKTSVSRV